MQDTESSRAVSSAASTTAMHGSDLVGKAMVRCCLMHALRSHVKPVYLKKPVI